MLFLCLEPPTTQGNIQAPCALPLPRPDASRGPFPNHAELPGKLWGNWHFPNITFARAGISAWNALPSCFLNDILLLFLPGWTEMSPLQRGHPDHMYHQFIGSWVSHNTPPPRFSAQPLWGWRWWRPAPGVMFPEPQPFLSSLFLVPHAPCSPKSFLPSNPLPEQTFILSITACFFPLKKTKKNFTSKWTSASPSHRRGRFLWKEEKSVVLWSRALPNTRGSKEHTC